MLLIFTQPQEEIFQVKKLRHGDHTDSKEQTQDIEPCCLGADNNEGEWLRPRSQNFISTERQLKDTEY